MKPNRNRPLSREDFHNAVLTRDGGLCVACKSPAVDAHHIVERRLWDDGGYFLDNGASLCNPCHEKAETTEISADSLRLLCGIDQPLLPSHLDLCHEYDKWGNIVLPNGQRVIGELFFEEGVQKSLARGGFLETFQTVVKHPRTPHLPWSQSVSDDDTSLLSVSGFEGREVVFTEKMDGENTSMYADRFHARSLDSPHHPSRNMAKALWGRIAHEIPKGWRLCGENVYAVHAIEYKDLSSHFNLFSVWNSSNTCLSWDDTVLWAELLGLETVPVIWRGVWDEKIARSLWDESKGDVSEGHVARLASSFKYSEFRKSTAKFVRKGHVNEGDEHWRNKPVRPNGFSRRGP